jgi:hypothetical protein
MDLLERGAPAPVAASGLTLVPLHGARWRVIRRDGSVLGYLERADDRYRALRMRGSRPRLVELGDFARPDDALAALR